jgi:hypothetical protein
MPEDLCGTSAGVERARRLQRAWIGPAKAVQDLANDLAQLAPQATARARVAIQHDGGLLRDGDHRIVATLRGGVCLVYDIPKLLNSLDDQMTMAQAMMATAAADPQAREALNRAKAEIKSGMITAAKLMVSARKFCEPENLRGLARWASVEAEPGRRHRIREAEAGLEYVVETGRDSTGSIVWWSIAVPAPSAFAPADDPVPATVFAVPAPEGNSGFRPH